MQINIYDANNHFRVYLETDTSGTPVSKLYNEIQMAPPDILSIVIWDGQGGLARRRELYPEYKAKRKPADISKYQAMDKLRQVLELSSALSIRIPGWEADDVIAHVVKKFQAQGLGKNILLHSNDADFLQLGVRMTDPPSLSTKVEARWIPLYKTLVGDSSDNIPGLKGFGETAWKFPVFNKEMIERFVSDLDIPLTREYVFEAYPNTKQVDAMMAPGVRERLNMFWKLVNFLPIEDEVVNQHSIQGINNPEAAREIFKEFKI